MNKCAKENAEPTNWWSSFMLMKSLWLSFDLFLQMISVWFQKVKHSRLSREKLKETKKEKSSEITETERNAFWETFFLLRHTNEVISEVLQNKREKVLHSEPYMLKSSFFLIFIFVASLSSLSILWILHPFYFLCELFFILSFIQRDVCVWVCVIVLCIYSKTMDRTFTLH